ncbi:helix-turn-helix domain-containing protein [Thauera aromatica]|uniref:helix-turn-helix domain-containing protein n=1 Tax=Thauera aromatica TaxID=59405 RepID=UPI001FFDE1B1|nr:helix-turn-helix domain-containing protein [Thauera aromatica]MCK2097543.1 helix-turn-helix domain-containing protein [Thauera aromatica]
MDERISKDRYLSNREVDCHEHQNSDMETFGSRVREARKKMKMSQVALASAVGMSQGNLSDIENGHVPTSTYTPSIAAVLGVNALWLAEGRGPKHPNGPALPEPSNVSAGVALSNDERALLSAYRLLPSVDQAELRRIADEKAQRTRDLLSDPRVHELLREIEQRKK